MSRTTVLTLLVASIGWAGCSGTRAPEPTLPWADLIEQMTEPERIARIDAPGTGLLSSADPTGGNDDFNHDRGVSSDGWNILADLEGPGYVSRFWFTGAANDSHRIRFYFDDEKEPRIDTTLGKFCGGEAPFLPPLATYEQGCWWNLAPIPYQKRLRILSERVALDRNGWPRHFHQINFTRLPEDEVVESYPIHPSSANLERLAAVRQAWDAAVDDTPSLQALTVPPGEMMDAYVANHPGVVKALRVRVEHPEGISATDREQVLRDVQLQCRWDGRKDPSVHVPLGDFFGSVWRPTLFQSQYFGADAEGYFSRFPMPFHTGARISFLNESAHPVTLHVGVEVEERPHTPNHGYFHAAWRRSGPAQQGQPHQVLRCNGTGRFAGCLLAVTSLDNSWWILESDETMRIDGAADPQWKGTGLEDYFNGGWYYTNAKARPLHGLLFKAPFRTVQYRMHADDAVMFQRSFDMTFERGPNQGSKGWMTSVAYYYLDDAQPADSDLPAAADRHMPPLPIDELTIMAELANLERLGGHAVASDRIDAYLERFPTTTFAPQLRLRKLAYGEAMQGIAAAESGYRDFLKAPGNPEAAHQAEDLLWFHEDPSHALLSVYCANKTRLFLDGRPIVTVQDPGTVHVLRVDVDPGAHALALEAAVRPYPQWVMAHLRTHYGNVSTQPNWRFTFDPVGLWKNTGYDETGWAPMGGDGVKGPPEAPYLSTEPNAYVSTVSEARGIRPRGPTARQDGAFVFRREFLLE